MGRGVQNYKFASLVFLDIMQNCSLGQCLLSSSTETSKKECGPNQGLTGPIQVLNDLFCPNVVGHLVKLACLIKTLIFHIFLCNLQLINTIDLKKELFQLNISTKKDTLKDNNINISSLKYSFKSLGYTLQAHTSRSTTQLNLFQNFCTTSSWSFWK